MEQLHARDRYRNVTEHKPQATVCETKISRYAQLQHRKWVRLSSPACMSCPVCMVAACTQV